MKISCESCGTEDWKMVIHEVRVPGGGVIYSAMKCENCGMVYPLQEWPRAAECVLIKTV